MERTPARPPFSPAETLVEVPKLNDLCVSDSKLEQKELASVTGEQPLSVARRYFLLVLFCIAQFLDSFYNNALFSAIPALKEQLSMTESDATWLFSAYSLTFASFLLMSGRISDVYNPKHAFFVGVFGLGVASIVSGFLNNKIVLLVLRAISGIFASLTIPSALRLLVHVFPDPDEQARAIGIFGGSGAVASVMGLIIGAILVQWASWRWVFWVAAIIAIPVATLCLWFIPHVGAAEIRNDRFRCLDIPGITILTSALLLFIFAISSSAAAGWGSAMVLAPLLISIVLAVGFFYWEAYVPEDQAAIPPRTWSYTNFGVLLGVALLPYFWWTTLFTMFTTLWQEVYGWSAISTAIRIIPIGAISFVFSFSSRLGRYIGSKWLILIGMAAMIIATVLFTFADSPNRYWGFAFPGFIIGSAGATLTFTHMNIAIFRSTPSEAAGIVGACLNSALQLGSAVCLSVSTSIESSIEKKQPGGFTSYEGRRAVFWFALGIVILEALSVMAFYRQGDTVKRSSSVEASGSQVNIERPAPSNGADAEKEVSISAHTKEIV